jgi:DNA-directed RNA polymerase subunit M/transcription elongation factor TFIIS
MARRRIASSIDASKRACPVCAKNRIHAVFKQRQTVKKRRVDQSTCVCLECGAAWNESYMVRAQEIRTSNVLTREAQAAARPIDRTASKTADLAAHSHTDNQDVGCPICGAIHIGVKPHGPLAASCTCVDCGATWDHRYANGEAYRSNIKQAV